MKRLLLPIILYLSAFTFSAYAENITCEKAREIASRFFEHHDTTDGITAKSTAMPVLLWDSRAIAPNASRTASSADQADESVTFYAFGSTTGKGFVLIAADNAVRPILGYALDQTAPAADRIPDNMAAYLQSLSEQIAYARQTQPQTPNNELQAADARAGEAVGQVKVNLQTARWGQFKPFNLKCPQDNGSYCATGCIPTAFSIIMRYHRWPDCGEGILPAYLSGSKGYPIAECDLSQHTYRWDLMPESYNDIRYTDEQADAVSLLMADVGHCFEVIYGVGGTGGYHSTASFKKFLSHFKYDAAGERIDRDILLNDDEWIRRIKEDLDANRPIAYSATSATNKDLPDGRHIFVCDGYTDQNYFHFNWGWGGNGNGYFTLSAMNPNESYNFILHHIAYFNINPLKPAATYTVHASATEGGTARVDGRPTTTVKEGSTVKLTARAQYDYLFTHWSVNGVKVSESANYEPVIMKNTDFLAHFIPKDTGIEEAEGNCLQLTATPSGTLHIGNYTGLVYLYNIKGQLIKSVSVNGSAEVQLPGGVYLVKAGTQHSKISLP